MVEIPQRYVPSYLTSKDKTKQIKELKKSRKAYKKSTKNPNKKYITRKKIKSFTSRTSPHILKARKMYKTRKIVPSKALEKATQCKRAGLEKIVNKGKGRIFHPDLVQIKLRILGAMRV